MVRLKNRYIVVEITEPSKPIQAPLILKEFSLHRAILNTVQKLHGDFGVAAITAGFMAKYCNEKTRMAVIRCRHGPHVLVASSIPFVHSIEGRLIRMSSLYMGATMKHCFRFIQRYQEKKFKEYCLGLDEEEKSELRKELMNLDVLRSIN